MCRVQLWILPLVIIVANLFMEDFEAKAINTASLLLRLWLRLVDDTSVIEKAQYSHQFLQHIKSPLIYNLLQTPYTDRPIPFWRP